MCNSSIFFDGIDAVSIDMVKPVLSKLGCGIELFFGSKVSYVVTRRPVDGQYSPSDLLYKANQMKINIWNYEKLVRILTSISGHDIRPVGATTATTNLSHMLREEKLVGPNDRDPSAKRDDYHYFKSPYAMVWDPTHHYRPFLLKEYENSIAWPQLKGTPHGSPFGEDYKVKAERVALGKRRAREEAAEPTARKVIIREMSPRPDATPGGGDAKLVTTLATPGTASRTVAEHIAYDTPATPGTPGTPETPFRPMNRNHFHEIVASGVNNMSATRSGGQSYAGQMGGNGLNPIIAEVPSKEVLRLKRQMLSKEAQKVGGGGVTSGSNELVDAIKRVSQAPKGAAVVTGTGTGTAVTGNGATAGLDDEPGIASVPSKKGRDLRLSYCENCFEKYEHYSSHILTKKHSKYAADEKNFEKLDRVIGDFKRRPKFLGSRATVTAAAPAAAPAAPE